MVLPARFSQLDADLDAFLFAPIGEEKNGMPLTMASALARRGIDPWTESRRLAELPNARATEILAAMIATLSLVRPRPSDAAGIAARLITLLPTNGRDAPLDGDSIAPATDRKTSPRGLWLRLLYLALILVALFYLGTDRKVTPHAQEALAVFDGMRAR